LSNAFGHLVETFGRIPHSGFIAGWFALALLLAGALVYVWSSIAAKRAAGTRPGPRQK
jgi:hypothetical protein